MATRDLLVTLASAIEDAQHKPGDWASALTAMGCIASPPEDGNPFENETTWANFSYKRDSWLAFEAVNALPKLLAVGHVARQLLTAVRASDADGIEDSADALEHALAELCTPFGGAPDEASA
jgi:hypothetical protein